MANRASKNRSVSAGGAIPARTEEATARSDAVTSETPATIRWAATPTRVRHSGRRLGRVAVATALAVSFSLSLVATPAHAFRWTRGTVSPFVIDCRSGVVCMRSGQIDWVETCRQFRDQHETFCEAEGL